METSWKITLPIQSLEINLTPQEWEENRHDLGAFLVKKKLKDPNQLFRIVKKSLDARKRSIVYRLKIELLYKEAKTQWTLPNLEVPQNARKVHIIGFGPAGIFAALECLKRGYKPVVIERGKNVKERRRDVAKLSRDGILDPDSNYCFGEGGAGTFSDGKLYTRSHKRGKISEILEMLVWHGAAKEIIYEAHPHIGTNKLPAIIENLRRTIEQAGGEVRFNAKLTKLTCQGSKVISLDINGQNEPCDQVILATGHSARDIYYMLAKEDVLIEAKPFAMGFRIEHPQAIVDQIQYHKQDTAFLPPASYRIVQQVKGKGVFSFCMCPGGIVAPASTDELGVVVNGWSPSKRNGKFANSGWVTEIGEEEWREFKHFGPLAGLEFQKKIEEKAKFMAGGSMKVPGQNLLDFLNQRKSLKINDSSYHPGITPADLNLLYPSSISYRLREGLRLAAKKMKGFADPQAVLVGPESRTSSPIRIPRTEALHHPQLINLYPCGEGAGYAGGILSAALDGIRVARKIET